MFTLDLSPSYPWPVTLQIAADGGHQEMTFNAHFKRATSDEVREILYPKGADEREPAIVLDEISKVLQGGSDEDLPDSAAILERVRLITTPRAKGQTDEEFCREWVVGWDGITDSKGADLPFSKATLAKLLKVHGAPSAIVKAWLESINPEVKDTGKRRPRT